MKQNKDAQNGVWETPWNLFRLLDSEFHFTVDVCATAENAKCAKYFSPEIDGLKQDWSGETCWMNPPYGRQIGQWMRKAYQEAKLNRSLVVCLIPARTDTQWWWETCALASEIRFLKGRVSFGGEYSAGKFPSAVVIFGGISNHRETNLTQGLERRPLMVSWWNWKAELVYAD